MRNKIMTIVTIFILFMLSKGCISDYVKGGDNKAISNYEKMLFDNSTTMAELYPGYKEVTIKIMGGKTKTYKFRYKFNVNGTQYEGEHSFDELPTASLVKVYYLSTDPYFNCVDPEQKLQVEKGKNTSKSDLYWGIGWGVLSLLMLLGFIKELREKKAIQQV